MVYIVIIIWEGVRVVVEMESEVVLFELVKIDNLGRKDRKTTGFLYEH